MYSSVDVLLCRHVKRPVKQKCTKKKSCDVKVRAWANGKSLLTNQSVGFVDVYFMVILLTKKRENIRAQQFLGDKSQRKTVLYHHINKHDISLNSIKEAIPNLPTFKHACG